MKKKNLKINPKKSPAKNQLTILEASRAIALTINNIGPAVVSAYPITPQTHIVEDLAKFKADGDAEYEYARAESEFAAASIILGASAAGVRTYSATSSQGLLLMTEVIFNIAGLRLPIVMTCANRSVSSPINIWNDQQDVMTIRDSGWILLFAENHQEAVDQHVLAYKLAEKLNLPVMVNVDGFVVTHAFEPVYLPPKNLIKKFLPAYRPAADKYLNPKYPTTFGAFVSPADYFEIRQELHDDLQKALPVLETEYKNYQKIFATNKISVPCSYADHTSCISLNSVPISSSNILTPVISPCSAPITRLISHINKRP
jgi:pyruvate ferredoxin oxidoreductase alpha subunit